MNKVFTDNGWKDYLYWQTEDRKTLKKINQLIDEISRNGNEGIGKPEPLTGNLTGFWSRRINDKDRLIYKIDADNVYVLACRYHYNGLKPCKRNTKVDAATWDRYNDLIRRRPPMDERILKELVDGILRIVNNRVLSIILYGSVARGTNTDESDVDIAVLMKGNQDGDTEDKLSEFIVDMNLEYDKVFSVIDIDYALFCKWEKVTPFYQNMNREGVVLWKAA